VKDVSLPDIEQYTDEVKTAMQRLPALLGMEHVALLLELLETILGDTGYGGVEIVVADGRVQTMKLTKSYRAREK
jgi:hypothetical protein